MENRETFGRRNFLKGLSVGAAAVPLFGEIPTLLQLGGMALVLGSVLLYTRAESGPKA